MTERADTEKYPYRLFALLVYFLEESEKVGLCGDYREGKHERDVKAGTDKRE